ncbi:chloride channel protein [Synechococcus sp. UW140]|uniref:chloride channel protein n=1 Tax=Synechococcus sp. UW140 TaxID=368503 RepID=UPI0025F03BF6|nr:chloride channel protein [Synechococcus sp. UW140]
MLDPKAEATAAPFQWGLLAWAALVGLSTGFAIVGFHYLLGFINNLIYGPFVAFVIDAVGPHPVLPELLPPPPPAATSTPLQSLLQIGLGGLGVLSPPVALPPEPVLPPIPMPPPWLSSWPVVLGPLLGGVLVGLLRLITKDLGPSLPSLMAMADGRMQSEPRLPFARLLGASISLGSGASLGPEGPSVEGGGNIGLWLGKRAGLPPDSLKALVGAGVAAGLAAGFRAPIAGVFFAFEGAYSTIPGRPSLRAVLVAAVCSTLVTQLGLGDTPIFRLPAYEVRSPLELPLYLGLGLLASFVSWGLVRLLGLGRSEFVQVQLGKMPPWLLTGAGGLAVGLLALGFPQVLGVGYDTIESLLGSGGGISLLTLFGLLLVKLLATAISNATGFIGGGFAPSLFLGAVLGNFYGQLLGDGGFGLPVAEAPAYAMVGMAAVLAGAARAPLTALLLLFELTRDIRIVLPLMAATGLSALLVERWQGLADPGLLGPDPAEEQRRTQLQQLPVLDALEQEAPLVLPADLAPATALGMLLDARGHCLLVEQSGWVKGLITLADLQQVLNSNRNISFLSDCLRSELVWLPTSADLSRLEDQLRPNGLRQLPLFIVEDGLSAQLPQGLPPEGLAVTQLRGIASRDGMSRALARQLKG